MSTLPPQQSATYKALKALADNPTVQALPLTKSEIWSVPADKVDAVMKAASQHGVGVRQLSERTAADPGPRRRTRGAIPEASREPRDDWNQIFRLAPADIKMNDKQKQLMEIAKASRATVGVGVMETPFAPVVEYALTKDAGLPYAIQGFRKNFRHAQPEHRLDDQSYERRHHATHVHLARQRRRNGSAGDHHVVAGRQDDWLGPA